MAQRDTSGRPRLAPFDRIQSELDPDTFYQPVSGTARSATFTTSRSIGPSRPLASPPAFRAPATVRSWPLDAAAAEQGAVKPPAGIDGFVYAAPDMHHGRGDRRDRRDASPSGSNVAPTRGRQPMNAPGVASTAKRRGVL